MSKRRSKGVSRVRPDARKTELAALAKLADRKIDTGDIPEVRDWSGAKRGLFYRPVKH